ncbi:MAG: alpha/beta fold hydrolase [Actinomycetota bacterium]
MESTCHRLYVAADRDDPTGGIVSLPVVILHHPGPDTPDDALIAPAGGPGAEQAERLGTPAADPRSFGRDVVVYDQRGIGLATPALDCATVDEAILDALDETDPFQVEGTQLRDALTACADEFTASGVDLTDYNSVASAHDLEDLRVALGYDQWTMIGFSYGARLTLTTLREHPESVRAAVLDSALDVTSFGWDDVFANADRALLELVEACAASEPCSARGDLGETIERIRADYNHEPLVIEATVAGARRPLMVTGDDLMTAIFFAMYNAEGLPSLPANIDRIAEREEAIVKQLVRPMAELPAFQAEVMAYAVTCTDSAGLDLGAINRAALEDPGRWSTRATFGFVCPPEWPAAEADDNEPISSDAPTLILAGAYDPITAPGPTLALADRFPNSTAVLHPAGSHGVFFSHPCLVLLTRAFIADPNSVLDTGCVDNLEELRPD